MKGIEQENHIRPSHSPRKKFINPNLNEGIRAVELRTIFPDGTNQIIPTVQALAQAKTLNLDLIVVSPTSSPPVAKIFDHGKFMFEEKKKKHAAKRNQHVVQLKELKFRPSTDEHDYAFKARHAAEFLQEGHKVKAVVQFRGREVAHADLGRALLQRLIEEVAAHGKPEAMPRQEGKCAFVIISPVSKK